LKLNPEFAKIVKAKGDSNEIDLEGKKIHGLIQDRLSKKNPKNPNGIIEDPIIRFKIDFDTFPQKYKHKFLVGQPRT
jgi:hypothetical protein